MEVTNGTIYNSLVYVQSMLKSRLINLDLTLIQLLRGLEFSKDRQCAQSIACITTNIFNAWNEIP